jgi:hypothetical protein
VQVNIFLLRKLPESIAGNYNKLNKITFSKKLDHNKKALSFESAFPF